MPATPPPRPRPTPILPWDDVLSIPITELVGSWDGTTGAMYQELGIGLANGHTLNLSFPERSFRFDDSSVPVVFGDDHIDAETPFSSIIGHTLRGLIYYDTGISLHHYAVLDNGHYLTRYVSFNYTEFAHGSFRAWRDTVPVSHVLPAE